MTDRKPLLTLRIFDDGVCGIYRGKQWERSERFVRCVLNINGKRHTVAYEVERCGADLWPIIERALRFLAPPRLPMPPLTKEPT